MTRVLAGRCSRCGKFAVSLFMPPWAPPAQPEYPEEAYELHIRQEIYCEGCLEILEDERCDC